MHISKALFVSAGAVALSSSFALAGPDWVERDDAGSDVGSAQVIEVDADSVRTISGTLTSGRDTPDFEDVYRLKIVKPSIFHISLRSAPFDTQLWVFQVFTDGSFSQAYGKLANDDADSETPGSELFNFSTDSTETSINEPGDYLVAISTKFRAPVSDGGLIFNFATPTEVSGPDGPGGSIPFFGWTGQGAGGGAYTLLLDGTAPATTPAPGAVAAGGLALAFASRRRRA